MGWLDHVLDHYSSEVISVSVGNDSSGPDPGGGGGGSQDNV